MPTQVMVSITFTTDDPDTVDGIVNGFTGLPSGALVNTNMSSSVDGASGTVDDGGNIVAPESFAPPPPTQEPAS